MIKESLALTIVYLHTTSAQTAYLEQTAVLFNRGKVSIMVKNPPVNARDTGWIPDGGRSHMPWGN